MFETRLKVLADGNFEAIPVVDVTNDTNFTTLNINGLALPIVNINGGSTTLPAPGTNYLLDYLTYDSNSNLVWKNISTTLLDDLKVTKKRRAEISSAGILVDGNTEIDLLELARTQENVIFSDFNVIYTNNAPELTTAKFNYDKDVDILFKLRITGTFQGSPNADRDLIAYFRRPFDSTVSPNDVIESQIIERTSEVALDSSTINTFSYIRGVNDPFITEGFTLTLLNNNGQDLTITNIEFITTLI